MFSNDGIRRQTNGFIWEIFVPTDSVVTFKMLMWCVHVMIVTVHLRVVLKISFDNRHKFKIDYHLH